MHTMTKQERQTFLQEMQAASIYSSHVTLPVSKILAALESWVETEFELIDAEDDCKRLREMVEGPGSTAVPY
jgi:hypothetical protein